MRGFGQGGLAEEPTEIADLQEVRLPETGAVDVRLVRWVVDAGDFVDADETLLYVDLDGEEGELTAACAGTVIEIVAMPGEPLAAGTLLATIEAGSRSEEARGSAAGEAEEGGHEPEETAAFGEEPSPRVSSESPDDGVQETSGTEDDAAEPVFEAVASGFTPPPPLRPLLLDEPATRLGSLSEDSRPASRIEAARAIFQDFAVCWNQFAEEADRYHDKIEAAAARSVAASKAARDRSVSRIDADLEALTADSSRRIGALQQQLDTRIAEGTAMVRRVWTRIGYGLELDPPERELTRRRDGDPRDPTYVSADLASLEQQSAQLPQVPAAGQDPWLSSYAGGVGFGALIFSVLLFQNFVVGLAFGAIAGAGTLFARRSTRDGYAQLYDSLLSAVVQDEHALAHSLSAEANALRTEVEAAEGAATAARAQARRRHEAVCAAISAEAASAREDGKLICETSAVVAEGLIERIQASIAVSVSAAPDLYGDWDAAGDLPERKDLALADRTAIRIGEASGELLRSCRLHPAPSTPPGLGPQFWHLGTERSLLVSNDRASSQGNGSVVTPALLRVLHQMPRGKVHLTLFDPLGLGRNFAAFLELGEGPAQLLGGRVWTNKDHLRQRLRELIEHVERVTQKYLQNKFADIESYSVENHDVPEPYRFLVIEDFPECFDEDTVRDLARILQNGPRCGVYVAMHRNKKVPLPRGVDFEVLRPFFLELAEVDGTAGHAVIDRGGAANGAATLDRMPAGTRAADVVRQFSAGAVEALAVEVTYTRMLEKAGKQEVWKAKSGEGISVPLGPAGRNVQMLTLGQRSGLAHHALLVGRPGSGKSNLLHVFITTAARLYSPHELQFYLIDFKQGVEFKPYAEAPLPHAHVVALQSEREFGLSVLQGLEAEMARRGDLFAREGVQNLAEYRTRMEDQEEADPRCILPRIVLVVDEFQQFFARDDRIKREAAISIGRLVSQARSAGIHLVFGTQSLATATLDRAIRDQITVRIALQCSEADSRLILAEDNVAARMLTRPGEAIFNADAGNKDSNSLFQGALFKEADRDRELQTITAAATECRWEGGGPTVFAGHEPGNIMACKAIAAPKPAGSRPREMELWLGESTTLKPVDAPPLKRHPGRNLLVLSREEAEGVGVVLAAMLSLAVQCPPAGARFLILDLTSVDSDWADQPEEFADTMPHEAIVFGRHQARELFDDVAREVRRRAVDEEHRRAEEEKRRAAEVASRAPGGNKRRPAPAAAMGEPQLFLVLLGLHRIRELRTEGSASSRRFGLLDNDEGTTDPRSALVQVLKDGPEVGVHTMIWCDVYTNLERAIGKDGIDELGIKASGPLSDQESRRLFDGDVAAGIDKPHRMVLGDDDRVGVVEMFRPFRIPTYELIGEVGAALSAGAQPPLQPPQD